MISTRWMCLVCLVAAASAGGGCDDAPPDGPDTPDPVQADAIDRACARIASCQPPGSAPVEDCVATTMTRPASGLRLTAEMVSCLDDAGADCAAALACLPAAEGDPCQGRGNETFCQGNLLIRCFAQRVEAATDCYAWGLACAESDAFEPTCLGEGSSCIRGDERCDGDDAVLCIGFREVAFDCSNLVTGRVCAGDGDTVRCAPPEPECDPRTTPTTCDDGSLVLCSAEGRPTRIDCASLGFTGCSDESGRAICE